MARNLLAGYAALVLIGLIVMTARFESWAVKDHVDGSSWLSTPRVFYLTSRHLPANHRLAESDLKVPEGLPASLAVGLPKPQALVGRYLSTELETGRSIVPRELLDRPIEPEDKTFTRIPVSGELQSRVNVSRCVTLCQDNTCLEEAFVVLAVDCLTPAGSDCELLLEDESASVASSAYRAGNRVVVLVPCD